MPVLPRRIGISKCFSASLVAKCLAVMLGIVLLSLPAFSQGSNGTIQGGVFDQTGGAVSGAAVTVTDVARGATRTLTTDSAGAYIATNLIPGLYTVKAEAKGFQTVEHSNVQVEVGTNSRVDFTLQPGAQTQTVTVTSEAPAVDTTDATLGGTVSNAAILALPLNGRNFERLLQLRPGVATNPGAGAGESSTNGRRTGNDLLLVEGIPLIGPSNGGTTLNSVYRTGDANSLLPIDAIQEFNTEQNPKAEYGWRDGSVIDVGVKSGTNDLHGAAYAFGRDAEALDARNAFTAPNAVPSVTPATVEQFGAVGGGRIVKDKLFWFLGYEGLRTTLTNPFVDQIPADVAFGTTPATQNVNLSMVDACNALAGPGKTVGVGPFTPVGTPQGVSALSAQLAGITIDPVNGCKVSPSSSSFENLFPYNPTQNINYTPNLVTTGPLNNGFIKGDYAISQHQHLSGFYFISKSSQLVQYSNSQLTPNWEANVPSNVQQWTGNYTWTPNSTWVNEFRGGYGFLDAQTISADVGMFTQPAWPNGYGFNSGVTQKTPISYGGLPNIVFSGAFNSYLGAGKRTGVRGPEGNFSLIDNVSYLRGKHAFKWGAQYIDVIYDNDAYNYANGQAKFSSLTNFLSGVVKNGNLLVGNPNVVARAHWFGFFFQDDYRVTNRITANLGLRWEYEAPPVEQNNYEGTFVPTVNPAKTFAVQQAGPGTNVPNIYNADYRDFSPRGGLAWDVQGNGKTVVRAGASLMRNPEIVGEYIGFAPFGANVPSLGINTSGTALNAHTAEALPLGGCKSAPASGTQCGNFNWSIAGPVFPTGGTVTVSSNGGPATAYSGVTCLAPPPIDVVISGVTPPACSTQAVNPNFKQPYSIQWNLDIQRAITNNLTVDVAYIGVHGGNEATWTDINQPAIGAGYFTPSASLGGISPAASCAASAPTFTACGVLGSKGQNGAFNDAVTANEVATAPYGSQFPYLSNIVQLGNQDYSNYNGLQLTLNERATHGLSFLLGYTFAHALDIVSADSTSQSLLPIDSQNVKSSYGNSDFDIRQRFNFSPSYNIPSVKSPAQLLEGWSISGIVSLQSGLPWYPVEQTNDILGTGEINNSIDASIQTWNYSGPKSAFTSGPFGIPLLTGAAATNTCGAAAVAPYAPGSQLAVLAQAALANYGCYFQNGGYLTPPALGTIGNSGRNSFRVLPYYNVDMSIAKVWKFRERYTAQFRAEFFNIFNRTNYGAPAANQYDPGAGSSQFGCACATPDVAGNNPILGSGGPRHIQFGLKLSF